MCIRVVSGPQVFSLKKLRIPFGNFLRYQGIPFWNFNNTPSSLYYLPTYKHSRISHRRIHIPCTAGGMIAFARRFFGRYPLLANSIAYGTLYVSAEFSQQLLVKKVLTTQKQEIDIPTVGRYAVMGTLIYSPTLYTWYKWLDHKYPGTTSGIIVKKLILDQFLLTPVLLIMFYTGMSLMEGAENPFYELKEKFFPTFLRSCVFWLPAQSVNFLFVSPKFRVIYVGTCAFAWVNILCWIKRERLHQNDIVVVNDDRKVDK